MLEKIISGGRRGAEQGALRAARAAGIPTGGWAAQGWLVGPAGECPPEPAPWLADFGLAPLPGGDLDRIGANVAAADGTIWFGDRHTRDGRSTLDACRRLGRPYLIAAEGTRPASARAWLAEQGIRVLNVAGDGESDDPGLGDRAEAWLGRLFAAG